MGTYIKGKIKRYPSGLCSVVFSRQVAVGAGHGDIPPIAETGEMVVTPWQSCQSSASDSGDADAANGTKNSGAERSTKSGWGELGKKDKASWKSCRNLKERMAASELEYGTSNGILLTVTIPSNDERAYEGVARYSSYAMDRLNRELNRYFDGKEFARCTAWEYQRRGALHAHIYIAGNGIKKENIKKFTDRFLYVWYRILESIEKLFPCNMFLRKDGKRWNLSQLKKVKNRKKECVFVNCQKVRKSVVAYLSSYFADNPKDKKSRGKNNLRSKFYPIATWFQWNRIATKNYEKHYEEIDLGSCDIDMRDFLISRLEGLEDSIDKEINLAKNTDCIHAKNPYNDGIYWLPRIGRKDNDNADLLASFADSIKPFFRDKLTTSDERLNDDESEELDRSPYHSIDLFHERSYSGIDKLDGKWSQDWADCLTYFGLSLLDLFQEKCYALEANKPIETEQLKLCL